MSRAGVRVAAAAAGLLLAAAVAAEQTRTATIPASFLRDGTAQGVATTSRGRIQLAPAVTPATKPLASGDPSQVFAIALDASGQVFLGTGPDGQVLRASATGETQELFRAPEPLVTALLSVPGGDLLAATAPGGKIYRITPDGKGRVWSTTEERYVWALARGEGDTILAATGDRGRLLKIDRAGTAAVLFDADETHLVSLAPGTGGTTWVGGAGRGLVYRVDAAGRGTVVYDDDLPEAKSIVAQPDGSLIVAFDAAPAPDKRPPAVRIRVSGSGTAEGMSEIDTRDSSGMQGIIEGLGPTASDDGERLRGKVVKIAPEGSERELWRSTDEAPFALATDPDGRPLFATGEPARLWRVDGPGEIALVATLKESQATAMARDAKGLVLATSNPAAAYRVDAKRAESGTFVAPTLDAGGIARWGALSWRDEGDAGRVEIFTRTGNSAEPDATWTSWKGPSVDPEGSPLDGAVGRYLQWRARVTASSGVGPRISGITATYATRNRAPSIRDLRIDPSNGAVSSKATLRWSAADADGDGVVVDIEARKQGASEWKSAARSDPPAPKSGESSPADGFFKDGRVSWETATWDEGRYDVRAVASDQVGNPPGEGLATIADFDAVVRVDRTPPEIRAKRIAGGAVEAEVLDEVSGVARLEVVEDGRVVASVRADDGVADGGKEKFRLSVDAAGPAGARSLRATDTAGNSAEAKVPSP